MLTIGKRDAVFRYFPNNKDMYWRTTPNLLLGLMFTLVSLGDSIIPLHIIHGGSSFLKDVLDLREAKSHNDPTLEW